MKVGDDTVRIFSVHLQTSGISGLRQRFRKDHGRDVPVERVIGELERNSRIRAQQVREIRAVIDSTHYPVIVAGDFNDTPSSYTYPPAEGRHDRRIPGLSATDSAARSVIWAACCGSTISSMTTGLRAWVIYMPQDDVSDHKAVVAELRFRRI